MSEINSRLLEFTTRKGPDCIGRLPTPWPFPPKSIMYSNTDFLLRVALEGLDVLDRGDSQLKNFRFTRDDLNVVYRGFLALESLVSRKEDVPKNLEETLSSTGKSLTNISTYYQDKIAVSEMTRTRAGNDITETRAKMAALRAAGNHKDLLAYYPGFGALLDFNEDLLESASNIKKGDVIPLEAVRHKRELVTAFGKEVEFERAQCGAPAWLGTPESIRFFEEEISACSAQIHRNGPILESIQDVVSQLDTAINGPASNVILLRKIPASLQP